MRDQLPLPDLRFSTTSPLTPASITPAATAKRRTTTPSWSRWAGASPSSTTTATGLLDVFLAGGGTFGGPDHKQFLGLPCKLYRNLGGFRFQDVTAAVGLDKLSGGEPWFYNHGAAACDYDRDGWPDLLVTGWGRVALFRNVSDGEGGRKFEDVTAKAGLDKGITWATSAAWGDLDGDGYPELYLCQYVDWSWANHPPCSYDFIQPDVCSPKKFSALPHLLYRNNGDGTFTDVSKPAGLRVPRGEDDYAKLSLLPPRAVAALRDAAARKDFGKGLGVLMVDVNADGRPDVYVANDTTDNFLYMNRGRAGQLLLEEVGLGAGAARDGNGSPNGSMGIDAADFNGTGRPSLWVSNFEGEMNALYSNECERGQEGFAYQTQTVGLFSLGQSHVGWGTQFLDLDHRGWPDLFVTNGHVVRRPTGASKRFQKPMLLRNVAHPAKPGRRWFIDVRQQGGPYFEAEHCGRGAAFGDLDNDGRIDIVLNHLNEPAAVLGNVAATEGRHWLGVELRGRGRRCVVGARVVLEVGGRRLTGFCKGGGSYLATNDPRLTFGLGEAPEVGRLTVYWPSGKPEHWDGLGVDRYWTLREGEGAPGGPPEGAARPGK
jgi:hypothetical protein